MLDIDKCQYVLQNCRFMIKIIITKIKITTKKDKQPLIKCDCLSLIKIYYIFNIVILFNLFNLNYKISLIIKLNAYLTYIPPDFSDKFIIMFFICV